MERTWDWSVTGSDLGSLTHEQIRKLCRFAGLAGIEGHQQLFEGLRKNELDAIAGTYRDEGLRFSTFHLPYGGPEFDLAAFYETQRRGAVDHAKRWIENSATLGCRIGVTHPTENDYGVEVEGFDRYLGQLGRSLEQLLPFAEGFDYTVAVENMPAERRPDTWFGSVPKHFEAFIKHFDHPQLGFTFDGGHALVANGPHQFDELLEVMSAKVVAFHLSDNAGDRDSHLAPGHGLVDWGKVFRLAARTGFDGIMCIETAPFAPGPVPTSESYRKMVQDTDALVANTPADPR